VTGRHASQGDIEGGALPSRLSADSWTGLALLAASLAFLGLSVGLPQPALVPIGPGFYPRILFAVTAVLSAALVASDVMRGRRGEAPARAGAGNRRLVLATFAVFALYVAAMPPLGFRAATFAFVLALQVVIDPPRGRRWLLVGVVAVATTAVSYLVFERYLNVLLPRGRLTGF
jgi:hypothetical protein